MTGPGREASAVERWAWLAWALALAALTALPYLYLAGKAGRYAEAGARFNWILPPYPEDSFSYAAWVEQAASGAWLFQVKYTGIDHAAAVFHPFFLAVGWLSAASGLDASQSLFAARLVGVLVFAATLVWLLRLLPLRRSTRWIALALVALSSGTGALAARMGAPSADLWMPEINTLWSLTWNPVFTAALVLMLAVMGLVQRFLAERRLALLVWAGLATGLLAFVHPYDVPVCLGVATLAILSAGGRWRELAAYLLPGAPAIALQAFVAATHPVLSAHAGALMASPAPLVFLSGLGIPALLFVAGAVAVARDGSARAYRVPLLWVGVTCVLVYAPLWFQRHMILGIHVPVCIVGAVGLERIAARLSRGNAALRAAIAASVIAASSLTHLHVAAAQERALRSEPASYFLSAALAEAFAALEARSEPDDRVLAHPDVAVQIPGRTGNTVPLGHWAQSVDADEELRWLRFLFASGDDGRDAERLDSLAERRIRYVLVEPRLQRDWLGNRTPSWLAAGYAVVFQNSRTVLFEAREARR